MKGRFWALVGSILGLVMVSVPYLLLRDVASYWANFVYWLLITLVVLVVGVYKVNEWGD